MAATAGRRDGSQRQKPPAQRLGEKGQPAWRERYRQTGRVMADEPPDSSSEINQIEGLPSDGYPDHGD